MGPHHLVGPSRPHPDQRDGAPVRQRFPLAQPTARSGHRNRSGPSPPTTGTPESVIDSNDTNGVGHTFTIPTLGHQRPVDRRSRATPRTPCNVAPCTTNYDHNVVKFSFMTPGPGQYPWQCFVPCGRGLPLRQRRSHADGGVHGRVPQGGGVSPSRRDPPLPTADRHLGGPLRRARHRLLLRRRPPRAPGCDVVIGQRRSRPTSSSCS